MYSHFIFNSLWCFISKRIIPSVKPKDIFSAQGWYAQWAEPPTFPPPTLSHNYLNYNYNHPKCPPL